MMRNKGFLANSGARRLFNPSPARALAILRSCPVYQPTPLVELPSLAAGHDLAALYVKDESQRMRLGSFKALGGAFAIAHLICARAGETDPTTQTAKAAAGEMTFITASAGNHGLSVAAGARVFGASANVVLSASVPEGFADRIRALDANVIRVEGNYEDSVASAISAAEANGWFLLADGSWEGYVERPALVMEGYTVLAEECRAEFARQAEWPTHVLLQAGVGGLAAAAAAHIREFWSRQPVIIIVEPEAAPCLGESVKAHRMVRVSGPVSNMGRLDCKDASLIAFDALKDDADDFVTVSDTEAAAAADALAAHGLATTPSGAASMAAVLRGNFGPGSRVLAFATEGREDG